MLKVKVNLMIMVQNKGRYFMTGKKVTPMKNIEGKSNPIMTNENEITSKVILGDVFRKNTIPELKNDNAKMFF